MSTWDKACGNPCNDLFYECQSMISADTRYYNRKWQAFEDIKEGWVVCPKCGNEEIYYENPQTGNGLYNCDYCGYAAHDRKFKHPRFKVRKYIARRWINEDRKKRRIKERRRRHWNFIVAKGKNLDRIGEIWAISRNKGEHNKDYRERLRSAITNISHVDVGQERGNDGLERV